MTDGDIRAIAHRMLERMVIEHPAEAAALASLVLSEILAVGLFGGDQDEVSEFVAAVNVKLAEIALHHDKGASWKLVPAETPKWH